MNKKYKIIYADPPWTQKAGRPFGKYKTLNGKQVWNNISNKTRDLPYNTMDFNSIKKLEVSKIADENAVLFIWVTNKYLPLINEIIDAWEFKYSTTLIWCKKPFGGGMGGTFGVSAEFLIYARRGSLKPKSTTKINWFEVKRKYKNGYPNHSAKPDFFRELIEKTFDGNKIELFARQSADGWDSWGNEIQPTGKVGDILTNKFKVADEPSFCAAI